MTTASTPLVILASTDPVERDVAIVTALLDAPGWIALVHELVSESDDGHDMRLMQRIVTGDGEESSEVPMAHACPGCTAREAAVPALEEVLGRRPSGVILALPIEAEILPTARELSAALGAGDLQGAHLAGTCAVIDIAHVLDDLDGGDDALVAHVVSADVVVANGSDPKARDVIDGLRSARSILFDDVCQPWLAQAAAMQHDHQHLERCCDPQTLGRGHGVYASTPIPGGQVSMSGVFELELRSPRPFHPQRLMRVIRALGAHGAVSRGRFWVANRPDDLCAWDAVCGQVSIGVACPWEHDSDRECYLTVVGFNADPDRLRSAFASAIVTEHELAQGAALWLGEPDPLAPYLGERHAMHDGLAEAD